MAKPRNRTTLYRLIEAGQLAHRAFLAPMLKQGLVAGDDVLLLLLAEHKSATVVQLAEETGIPLDALSRHVQRLSDRGLVERKSLALRLTDRGAEVEQWLAAHWAALETLVTHGRKKKQRQALTAELARLADLLG